MTRKEKILLYIGKKAIKRQFLANNLNITKQNLAYHLNKNTDISLEMFNNMLNALGISEIILDELINNFDKSNIVK